MNRDQLVTIIAAIYDAALAEFIDYRGNPGPQGIACRIADNAVTTLYRNLGGNAEPSDYLSKAVHNEDPEALDVKSLAERTVDDLFVENICRLIREAT